MSKKEIEREILMKVKMIGNSIKCKPENPGHFFRRGILLTKLRKYSMAMEDYGEAIRLNPRFYQAYKNRGRILSELRRWRESIRDSSKAIEINDSLVQAYNNRGYAYFQVREYAKAIADYKKVNELDSDDTVATTNIEMCERRLEAQLRLDNQLKVELVEEFMGPPIRITGGTVVEKFPSSCMIAPTKMKYLGLKIDLEIPPELSPDSDPLMVQQVSVKDVKYNLSYRCETVSSKDRILYISLPIQQKYTSGSTLGRSIDATAVVKLKSENGRRFTLIKENAFRGIKNIKRRLEEEEEVEGEDNEYSPKMIHNILLEPCISFGEKYENILNRLIDRNDASYVYKNEGMLDFNYKITDCFYDQGRDKRFMLYPDISKECMDSVFETMIMSPSIDVNISLFTISLCIYVKILLIEINKYTSGPNYKDDDDKKRTIEKITVLYVKNLTWTDNIEGQIETLSMEIKELMRTIRETFIKKIIVRDIGSKISEYFGGLSYDVARKTEIRTQDPFSRIDGGNKILLSEYAGCGVCRHRSIVFKYICDLFGIQCRLLRGKVTSFGEENSHCWNQVRILDDIFYVDCNYSKIIVDDYQNSLHYKPLNKTIKGVTTNNIMRTHYLNTKKEKEHSIPKILHVDGKFYKITGIPNLVPGNKMLWSSQPDTKHMECITFKKDIFVKLASGSDVVSKRKIIKKDSKYIYEFDPFIMTNGEAWKSNFNVWMNLSSEYITRPKCVVPMCGIVRSRFINSIDVFNLLDDGNKQIYDHGKYICEITYMLLSVALALQYLHRCEIVHFNLNPSCILIDYDHHFKMIKSVKLSSLFRWKEMGQKINLTTDYSDFKSEFIDYSMRIACPEIDIYSFGKIMILLGKSCYIGYDNLNKLSKLCISKKPENRPSIDNVVDLLSKMLEFFHKRYQEAASLIYVKKHDIHDKKFKIKCVFCNENVVGDIHNCRDACDIGATHTCICPSGLVYQHKITNTTFIENMKSVFDNGDETATINCEDDNCPCSVVKCTDEVQFNDVGINIISNIVDVKDIICDLCEERVYVNMKDKTFTHVCSQCTVKNDSWDKFEYFHCIQNENSKTVIDIHKIDINVAFYGKKCCGGKFDICHNNMLKGKTIMKLNGSKVFVNSRYIRTSIPKKFKCVKCHNPLIIDETDYMLHHNCGDNDDMMLMSLKNIEYENLNNLRRRGGTMEEFLVSYRKGLKSQFITGEKYMIKYHY